MVPNKFEKQIKRHLQRRELTPSENAWQRIFEDIENTRKPEKKGYYWVGFAASFIGLLIVSVIYINNNSVDETNVQIVDSQKKIDVIKEVPVVNRPDYREEKSTDDAITNLDSSKINPKIEEEVTINRIDQKILINHKTEPSRESLIKGQEILNAKILEVVAHVNSLEKENIDLTNAEVDSLLRKAQTEIVANQALQNSNKIDPMALLTDVEDQLDQSFRDKLFERLKTGFVKVKTGVADSNN